MCVDRLPLLANTGVIWADTVAHCGPTFVGEFARTVTMTDLVTGWTGNASIRNNESQWMVTAVAALQSLFPLPLLVFDSDNGSEFINHDVADWLQEGDNAQTGSGPYKKNDQATVESKNNHVVRKHSFYWRCDTSEELALLGELWPLVSMRLNFFTRTKNPTGYATGTDGRRTRLYDKPKTPWQRVQKSGILTAEEVRAAHAQIAGVNPQPICPGGSTGSGFG